MLHRFSLVRAVMLANQNQVLTIPNKANVAPISDFFPQVNIKELRALTSISNVLSYTVMRLLQSVSSYTTFTWAQRHILHRLACQAFRPRTCSTLHNSEEDTVVILHAEVNLASESLRIHGELIYLSIWLVENRFFF